MYVLSNAYQTLDLPLPNVQARSITEEEIYSKFGFPISRIIDLGELGDIYLTVRTMYNVYCIACILAVYYIVFITVSCQLSCSQLCTQIF